MTRVFAFRKHNFNHVIKIVLCEAGDEKVDRLRSCNTYLNTFYTVTIRLTFRQKWDFPIVAFLFNHLQK